jgi:asparagine synthase (glutamine-hydrolysing)
MCGICGVLSGDGGRNEAEKMLVALQHRGPDVRQVQTFEGGTFGHARLSVIDTDARSNQPMESPGGHSLLVFNGEIYNFKQLRATLERQGERFQTSGDTEVLLRLLQREGKAALEKLRGMFAFAWIQKESGTLLLARDPFGKKPLYIMELDRNFYFSSEIRALLAVRKERKLANLSDFLMWQSPSPESSFIEGIREVKPGGWLEWQQGTIAEGRFFDLETAIGEAESRGPVSQEAFRAAFEQSVQRRLVADVPLGAFLSGGIDSTAIVTAMKRTSQADVRTFTVGFDAGAIDETRTAQETSIRLGTHHTTLLIKASEVPDLVPLAVANMDIPSADAVNTWLVSRETRNAGITVALSGLGGDELFGGYPSAGLALNPLLRALLPKKAVTSGLLSGRQSLRLRKLALLLQDGSPAGRVAASRVVFDTGLLQTLGFPVNTVTAGRHKTTPLHPDNALALAEFEQYCKRLLLRDSDQMSMAHALELRVPFLDIDFLDAAARLNAFPPKRTVHHRKWRFIQMLPGYFPAAFLNMPKTGFALPMEAWLRGPLKSYFESGLFESPVSDQVDRKGLERMYSDFQNNRNGVNWSRTWLLAVLGHWMRKHKVSA